MINGICVCLYMYGCALLDRWVYVLWCVSCLSLFLNIYKFLWFACFFALAFDVSSTVLQSYCDGTRSHMTRAPNPVTLSADTGSTSNISQNSPFNLSTRSQMCKNANLCLGETLTFIKYPTQCVICNNMTSLTPTKSVFRFEIY